MKREYEIGKGDFLGMRVYLRPITLEDGKYIVKWRNSEMVNSHCFDRSRVTIESNEAFYRNNVAPGKYRQFIVERVDDDYGVCSYPIATVYLKDFDQINHRCELCIFTSDDEEWNTQSQSIAIKQLLEKAFSEYSMHKVYTYVFADHPEEIALMKQAGLTEEALLSEEALDCDGKYVDVVRMKILANQYSSGQDD